jgi:hypothetical protein
MLKRRGLTESFTMSASCSMVAGGSAGSALCNEVRSAEIAGSTAPAVRVTRLTSL